MKIERDTDRYDLARMIAGALYSGLFINIMIPAGLLLVCYFLDQKGMVDNSIGMFANTLFYIFVVLSVVEGIVAVLWRNRGLAQPMIRRRETIEQDIREQLVVRLRPAFLLLAAVALNGIVYYLLTGRFEEALVFVVLSFVAFQVIRPRYGSLRKTIEQQEDMFEKGQKLVD